MDQVHYERHQYDYHLGYSKHDDFDEQVLSPNKIEAPTFDGRHDPWIFDMWIRDMDHYLSGITCLIIRKLDLLR